MKSIFKYVSLIAVLCIGLVSVFILVSLIPFEGNYTFRVVQSGSMEPAIQTGSVVATIPRAAYGVGDIVTFKGTPLNPMPTTHRIVGVEEGVSQRFLTQGDANEEMDYRTITQDEILGKVFLSVPYTGYVATYFGTPNGRATLVTVGILLLISMFAPWQMLFHTKPKEENDSV